MRWWKKKSRTLRVLLDDIIAMRNEDNLTGASLHGRKFVVTQDEFNKVAKCVQKDPSEPVKMYSYTLVVE